MDALVIPAAIVGLLTGFVVGVYAYAHVYAHFKAREEERAAKRIALAVQQAQAQRNKTQEIVNRMKAMYGPGLGDKEQVVSEEVEAILSAGPR